MVLLSSHTFVAFFAFTKKKHGGTWGIGMVLKNENTFALETTF